MGLVQWCSGHVFFLSWALHRIRWLTIIIEQYLAAPSSYMHLSPFTFGTNRDKCSRMKLGKYFRLLKMHGAMTDGIAEMARDGNYSITQGVVGSSREW